MTFVTIKRRAAMLLLSTMATMFISAVALGQETAANTPDVASQKSVTHVSVFELFQKGGVFMYPLAACSVIAVTIIVERFAALRRSQIIPARFLSGLKNVLRDPRRERDREAAIEYCRVRNSPMSRMLAAGIKRMPRGVTAAEKAIEDAGANEALKLRRNMRFLYAIGSVATLLGLIGTIAGMIRAFQVAAAAGIGRVDQLSKGIYEAMVCTFGGLAVAIVVTLFYYFFVGRIESLVAQLNDALTEFSDYYGFHNATQEELSAAQTLS